MFTKEIDTSGQQSIPALNQVRLPVRVTARTRLAFALTNIHGLVSRCYCFAALPSTPSCLLAAAPCCFYFQPLFKLTTIPGLQGHLPQSPAKHTKQMPMGGLITQLGVQAATVL